MEVVERTAANAWPAGPSAGGLAVDVPSHASANTAAAAVISARRRTYTSTSKDATGATVLANHPFNKQPTSQSSPISPPKRYNSYRNSTGPRPQPQVRGSLRRVPVDTTMAESKPIEAQNDQISVGTPVIPGQPC
jgi:hypothetical protein